ncbi:MAG: glycoside hydrolase family 127 protein [Clostridia bacterium]|nr:glycoside hydrolase family 127 protein [Clostridia bacterium]
MTPITNNTYIPRSDLAARAGLLAARMEKREYRPETVLNMDQAGWPGDWEGRTILALVRLAETTKKEPAYLHEIVDIVLGARNEHGYLGPIYEDGVANEQQLSGHSWLLRGLCAYYRCTRRPEVYDAALAIGRNLFLPLYDTYPTYPIKPEERVYSGDMAGNSAGMVGKWIISTDTGCAYIPLDGVSALYELTGDEDIGALLDRMIENFLKIDFLGISVQTHATLTGTRGILRTYRMTKNPAYLDAAKKLFAMYLEHGMTANYANYNWFGRPEWTEPCAVIDSFLCAVQLYAETGERAYLTTAQRIYYNGMGFGQRENGGFGCDTCLGAENTQDNRIIRMHCPEAYWCCTMRGGEGLASVAEYAYLVEDNRIVVPYFSSSEVYISIPGGSLTLVQKTGYPLNGKTVFSIPEIMEGTHITLSCYLPDTAENLTVSGAEYTVENGMLNLLLTDKTHEIVIDFALPFHTETPTGKHNIKDANAIFRGNLMYSVTTDTPLSVSAAELIRDTENPTAPHSLRPLYDAYETDHAPRQVLFS